MTAVCVVVQSRKPSSAKPGVACRHRHRQGRGGDLTLATHTLGAVFYILASRARYGHPSVLLAPTCAKLASQLLDPLRAVTSCEHRIKNDRDPRIPNCTHTPTAYALFDVSFSLPLFAPGLHHTPGRKRPTEQSSTFQAFHLIAYASPNPQYSERPFSICARSELEC